MSRKKTLLTLFFTMLKIGAFTFGGGHAMIPLLQNEYVQKKKWLDDDEFLDLIAIAESTPGPVAINSATYIGYKMAGFWGSFFSTLGIVVPSFTIIFVISLFFDRFLKFTVVANAFRGIQACVVYLILSAGVKMFKTLKKDAFGISVLIATLTAMILFSLFAVRFSTIFYILISGFLGWLLFFLHNRKEAHK